MFDKFDPWAELEREGRKASASLGTVAAREGQKSELEEEEKSEKMIPTPAKVAKVAKVGAPTPCTPGNSVGEEGNFSSTEQGANPRELSNEKNENPEGGAAKVAKVAKVDLRKTMLGMIKSRMETLDARMRGIPMRGITDHIKKHYPRLYEDALESENETFKIFDQCLEGKTGMAAFEAVLVEWMECLNSWITRAESELGKTKAVSSTPSKAAGRNSLFHGFLEDIRSGGFYSRHFPQVADYLHRELPAEEFEKLVKEYEAKSGQTLKLDDVSDAGKSPQSTLTQGKESVQKDPEIRCIDCRHFQGGPTPHSFGLCLHPVNTTKKGQWGMARHRCKEFVAFN